VGKPPVSLSSAPIMSEMLFEVTDWIRGGCFYVLCVAVSVGGLNMALLNTPVRKGSRY
jgi:hypothetical protein